MSDVQNQAVSANFLDTLDFEGVDPRDLFLNYSEEGAQKSFDYVNTVVQSAVAKIMQAAEVKLTTLETEYSALQEKTAKLQQEKEELSHDLSVANLENSDLNARVTNAARLLEEEKAENARLSSQVDDLRKEIAVGAANALKVEEVDVRSAHEKWLEQRQKEEDAKPVIYNIRWKDDIRRDAYLAELAETDETITIPYYAMTGDMKNGGTSMKGKYRVVTSEEAPSFRIEPAQETEVDSSSTGDLEMEEQPVMVPAFQGEEEYNYSIPTFGLADSTSEVDREPVTREEFEALKREVAEIKAQQGAGTVAA